jgi:hypothetical protein
MIKSGHEECQCLKLRLKCQLQSTRFRIGFQACAHSNYVCVTLPGKTCKTHTRLPQRYLHMWMFAKRYKRCNFLIRSIMGTIAIETFDRHARRAASRYEDTTRRETLEQLQSLRRIPVRDACEEIKRREAKTERKMRIQMFYTVYFFFAAFSADLVTIEAKTCEHLEHYQV